LEFCFLILSAAVCALRDQLDFKAAAGCQGTIFEGGRGWGLLARGFKARNSAFGRRHQLGLYIMYYG
jgi:hypothetical protein